MKESWLLLYVHVPVKDKATVEMECMEDGYLAKIVQGDGAQGIKVGEVLILVNAIEVG